MDQSQAFRRMAAFASDSVVPSNEQALIPFFPTGFWPQAPPAPDALHAAVRSGSQTRVRQLLAAGVTLNIHDSDGKSPLHYAIETASEPIAQLLLQHGADVDFPDAGRQTALMIAAASEHALDLSESITALLGKGPALSLVDLLGETVLHKAVSNGNKRKLPLQLVQHLIRAGCDLHVTNGCGDTAFHILLHGLSGRSLLELAMAETVLLFLESSTDRYQPTEDPCARHTLHSMQFDVFLNKLFQDEARIVRCTVEQKVLLAWKKVILIWLSLGANAMTPVSISGEGGRMMAFALLCFTDQANRTTSALQTEVNIVDNQALPFGRLLTQGSDISFLHSLITYVQTSNPDLLNTAPSSFGAESNAFHDGLFLHSTVTLFIDISSNAQTLQPTRLKPPIMTVLMKILSMSPHLDVIGLGGQTALVRLVKHGCKQLWEADLVEAVLTALKRGADPLLLTSAGVCALQLSVNESQTPDVVLTAMVRADLRLRDKIRTHNQMVEQKAREIKGNARKDGKKAESEMRKESKVCRKKGFYGLWQWAPWEKVMECSMISDRLRLLDMYSLRQASGSFKGDACGSGAARLWYCAKEFTLDQCRHQLDASLEPEYGKRTGSGRNLKAQQDSLRAQRINVAATLRSLHQRGQRVDQRHYDLLCELCLREKDSAQLFYAR
jgi:hypothetical protein